MPFVRSAETTNDVVVRALHSMKFQPVEVNFDATYVLAIYPVTETRSPAVADGRATHSVI